MKKLALAALLATVGTAAMATSGYVEPIVEPEIVVAHSSSSVGGIVVPLLLLLVALAVAS